MRKLSQLDQRLADAITHWLGECAYSEYDDPTRALQDAVEIVQEAGEHWIQDAGEKP